MDKHNKVPQYTDGVRKIVCLVKFDNGLYVKRTGYKWSFTDNVDEATHFTSLKRARASGLNRLNSIKDPKVTKPTAFYIEKWSYTYSIVKQTT